jgi:DtxR family manganese transport transcriptional regulator
MLSVHMATRPAQSPPRRTVDVQASARRHTRHRHANETAEDYVEAIEELTDSAGEARLVDLAQRMGVSHVTATRTVARLQRDGYLTTRPYRGIFLTERGTVLAREARERHQVVVEFLRSIGVPDGTAQADAEGIEHHVSPATLDALRRHLRAATPSRRR